jgi:hypothetical protein
MAEPKFDLPKSAEKQDKFPELRGQLIDFVSKASMDQLADIQKVMGLGIEAGRGEIDSHVKFRNYIINKIKDIEDWSATVDLFHKIMPEGEEIKKEQE